MKALEVVEETDPQGTVMGVLGVVNLPRGRIPPLLWYLMLAAIAAILGEGPSDGRRERGREATTGKPSGVLYLPAFYRSDRAGMMSH
jgi:hypothetical protein